MFFITIILPVAIGGWLRGLVFAGLAVGGLRIGGLGFRVRGSRGPKVDGEQGLWGF